MPTRGASSGLSSVGGRLSPRSTSERVAGMLVPCDPRSVCAFSIQGRAILPAFSHEALCHRLLMQEDSAIKSRL